MQDWRLKRLESRPSQRIALDMVDAEIDQRLHFLGRFHALAHRQHIKLLQHSDRMTDDDLLGPVSVDAAHQVHVELDDIRLKFCEKVEAGMTGTEIVDGGLEAQILIRCAGY